MKKLQYKQSYLLILIKTEQEKLGKQSKELAFYAHQKSFLFSLSFACSDGLIFVDICMAKYCLSNFRTPHRKQDHATKRLLLSIRQRRMSQFVYYQFLNIFILMDIEQFMDDGSNQFQYDQSQELRLPMELYDQESEQQCPIFQVTVDQAVEILSRKQNLVDIPLPELIQEAVNQYNFNHAQAKQLAKRIKKTKNILKRRRAKCRVVSYQYSSPVAQVEKKLFCLEESSTDKDTFIVEKQIKKQRNRISAQVSRDKKKCYVNGLEQKNKELARESENLKLENEKLRQQILQGKKGPNNLKPNKTQNKLKKLFVLLGIEIFNFQGKTASFVSQKQIQEEPKSTDLQPLQSKVILDEIKCELEQMDCQSLDDGMGLKRVIFVKIEEIKKKVKRLILPGTLAVSLVSIKSSFLF